MTTESETVNSDNATLIKANDKIEVTNENLNKEIILLIQRIDVSTLLKEIDMEEMRHMANQNMATNDTF